MNNLVIRKIYERDFSGLDKHFGASTRYKNPMSKWEGYWYQQEQGKRAVRVVEENNQVISIGTLKLVSDYSLKISR